MRFIDFYNAPVPESVLGLLDSGGFNVSNPEHCNLVAYFVVKYTQHIEKADDLIKTAEALLPGNPDSAFVRGFWAARQAGGHAGHACIRDACVEAVERAESFFEGNLSMWPACEAVLSQLSEHCLAVGPDHLALSAGQRAVAMFPDNALHHDHLSKALAGTGELEGAIKHLLISNHLAPSLIKEREISDLTVLLQSRAVDRRPVLKGRYPSTEEMRSSLRQSVEKYVLNEIVRDDSGVRFTPDTQIFTMGSCFAREMSLHLTNKGYKSFHLEVSEYINSTFANVAMLEWAEGKLASSSNLQRLDDLLLGMISPKGFIDKIASTSVFIYTLGVAPCFFERTTGEFVMPRPSAINSRALAEIFEFKMTSVSENLENLQVIFAFLKKYNPTAKFVVTLSPVPLKMTFGRTSAVLTDCLSKSTLRVAAEEFVSKAGADVLYWPSFEIVKWIGGHVGPFYGTDDGAAWHVSSDLVAMITDLFVEYFGSEPAPSFPKSS